MQEIIYVERERFVRLEVAMELGERITPRPWLLALAPLSRDLALLRGPEDLQAR